MRRMGVLVIGLLVLFAIQAASASASPRLLYLYRAGEFLASGAPVFLSSTDDNVTVTGEAGTVSCTGGPAELEGRDVTNGQTRDTITLEHSYFNLKFENPHGECGQAFALGGFPWTLTLTTNGKATVTGDISLTFAGGCVYTAKRLKASQSFGDLRVDMSGKMKGVKANRALGCERTATLDTGTLNGFGLSERILEDVI